jgi:microcystin-dependent protein
MKMILIALACAASLTGAGPAAAAPEPFVGEIMVMGSTYCPRGWAEMNGQLLSISQNTALFSLLGFAYGGDGQTTFALPRAKPAFSATGVPYTQCIALQGIFPSRN